MSRVLTPEQVRDGFAKRVATRANLRESESYLGPGADPAQVQDASFGVIWGRSEPPEKTGRRSHKDQLVRQFVAIRVAHRFNPKGRSDVIKRQISAVAAVRDAMLSDVDDVLHDCQKDLHWERTGAPVDLGDGARLVDVEFSVVYHEAIGGEEA
jgi:hypothetical protein